jgi:hypothetical protein
VYSIIVPLRICRAFRAALYARHRSLACASVNPTSTVYFRPFAKVFQFVHDRMNVR